jgi:hypothetical protein
MWPRITTEEEREMTYNVSYYGRKSMKCVHLLWASTHWLWNKNRWETVQYHKLHWHFVLSSFSLVQTIVLLKFTWLFTSKAFYTGKYNAKHSQLLTAIIQSNRMSWILSFDTYIYWQVMIVLPQFFWDFHQPVFHVQYAFILCS